MPLPGTKKISGNEHAGDGQSTLEFTFVMVAVALLILSLARVFTWVGQDLAQRRIAHDGVLTRDCGATGSCPLSQLRDVFFISNRIDAAADSDIYGNP